MRIERISDNQIRCTLSKRDLSERRLKISELAYGSDKAKELFRDMMEQANMDFGFDADDIPLMIEAIPTSKESIVLVITKVEDPEELEEKFSKFGNIIPLHELLKKRRRAKEHSGNHSKTSNSDFAKLYSFPSLSFIVNASKAVVHVYSGKNSVWKDEENSKYFLILNKDEKKSSFDNVCSILSEFGKKETLTYATQDYFNEHYKLILKDDAITKLSLL